MLLCVQARAASADEQDYCEKLGVSSFVIQLLLQEVTMEQRAEGFDTGEVALYEIREYLWRRKFGVELWRLSMKHSPFKLKMKWINLVNLVVGEQRTSGGSQNSDRLLHMLSLELSLFPRSRFFVRAAFRTSGNGDDLPKKLMLNASGVLSVKGAPT